ncbi:hypothetical protein MW887_002518 [Aspergillus wentii]|nr:hypothetical protein MW887_002518 [Aspergillus wentii]
MSHSQAEICISNEGVSKRARVNAEYAHTLEKRVRELEGELQQSNLRNGGSIPTAHPESPEQRPHSPTNQPPATTQSYCREGLNHPIAALNPYIAQQRGEYPTFSDHTEHDLIQTYLERVNPRYPSLHQDTFKDWYSSWKDGRILPDEEKWKSFFVNMVFSISLLITPQVSPDEMKLSQTLYSCATSSLGSVLANPDLVLHVQAYLMCTLHALHSPSSQTVLTMISATMRSCAVAELHLASAEPDITDASTALEVQSRRRIFWSAYAIDRLVSWIYHVPCSLADDNIHVELFANINDNELKTWTRSHSNSEIESTPRRTQVSSALHLIRGRRIQSRILSLMMRHDYETQWAHSHNWRLHILDELNQWKNQLQRHSDPSSKGYTSEGWVGMAYNYTVLLLYRPTKSNVRGLVGESCIQACVEIALCFRQYQKNRQTAQLWPGLLSQFGIGITLLYCFWATPPSSRSVVYHSRNVSATIRTCSVILAVFSEHWRQAEVLRDVFDALAESIPFQYSDIDGDTILPDSVTTFIQSKMPEIRSLVVNRDICRMMKEMVSEEYPWEGCPSDDLLGWSADDVHHPPTCYFCVQSQSVIERSALNSPGIWPVHALDNGLLMFPGLFGSAEF